MEPALDVQQEHFGAKVMHDFKFRVKSEDSFITFRMAFIDNTDNHQPSDNPCAVKAVMSSVLLYFDSLFPKPG